MDSNSATGATKRFDGAGEDATRRYWKWRTWAKAYLTLLEAKGTPKEAHGSALFSLLDGPAELALEGFEHRGTWCREWCRSTLLVPR